MSFQDFLVIAPRVAAAIRPSRRLFPFGFCRQSFTLPLAKGSSLVPRNVGHGMLRTLRVLEHQAIFGRSAAASFHALSIPRVRHFVLVEPVRAEMHPVQRTGILQPSFHSSRKIMSASVLLAKTRNSSTSSRFVRIQRMIETIGVMPVPEDVMMIAGELVQGGIGR